METITIDPVTRLEGHGKIDILLDNAGDVKDAYFKIPEFRGFEKFCEGRAAEEMPRITSRICGVCPTAHHTCSTKTLDSLFGVEPTSTAKKIRELMYDAFMIEDHIFHFYVLAGADFIVGPEADKTERNIFRVIEKVGLEIGKKVIGIRKQCREIIETIGGKPVHPVCGLPGGVSKSITTEDRDRFVKTATDCIDFAKFSLRTFEDLVLKNNEYLSYITGDIYKHATCYMGLVDKENKVNFYDGTVRVVDPDGKEFTRFNAEEYLDNIDEHIEPWSYGKFPYLKEVGWHGFEEGKIYRVGPLARLNVADGLATPLAQAEYEKMYEIFGCKPVHNTLAYHWARLIETLYASERMLELASDDEIISKDIRNMELQEPREGFGVIEAPRGILFHHYNTDKNAIITKANLVVATVHNNAGINMSVKKAATYFIERDRISEGLSNKVEMAFRAYDPCLACATHSLPGQMPLRIDIYKGNELIQSLSRRI